MITAFVSPTRRKPHKKREEVTPKIGAPTWLFLGPSGPSAIYVPSPLDDRSLAAYPSDYELQEFYAIVPAGDAAKRLWPLSCGGYPSSTSPSVASPLTSPGRMMVVTGRVHSDAMHDQPDILSSNLLAEPP